MYTASTGAERAYRARVAGGTLVVSLDGTVVQSVPLGARVVTLGRSPENAVVLPHQAVSRQHAEVRLESVGPAITDLGSTGGTFVDGARLLASQPVALTPQSDVRIGPYTLAYTPPADAAADGGPDGADGASGADDGGRPMVFELRRAVSDGRVLDTPESVALVPDDIIAPVAARPTWPLAPAEGPASRYLRDLPSIFQENEFLGRMLLIFETIWEPLERRQDHVALYFDPRTAPGPFLPWLATWLDLRLDAHWPEARRRRLLAEAMELYRWRGTPYGLARMIEVCTGVVPAVTENPAEPHTFRVAVRLPNDGTVSRATVEELVRAHKPAHVGYVLEVIP